MKNPRCNIQWQWFSRIFLLYTLLPLFISCSSYNRHSHFFMPAGDAEANIIAYVEERPAIEDDGKPDNDKGIVLYTFKYNKNHKLIEMSSLGGKREYLEDERGIAIYKFRRNSDDNTVQTSYLGKDGKLKENIDGKAIILFEYNDKGEIIHQKRFRVDGTLIK